VTTAPASDEIVTRLRAAGCVFAEQEAALLAAEADGVRLEALLVRRLAGEPLEQVLGWAEFCGRRVIVEPTVFVPRRRTELLVRAALASAGPGAVIVDLCCGTGAVAAVLRAELPDADVHAVELDAAAVRCARRNLPPERVHHGDLYAALPGHLRGRVDVLVANAPYVPTEAIALMPPEAREHEARIALDGGADGLEVHRRIVEGAPDWLTPGGRLIVETSAEQAAGTAALAAAAGLAPEVVEDGELGATAVVAALPGGSGPGGRPAPSTNL
jgi:release factor glutamine methyltransferase